MKNKLAKLKYLPNNFKVLEEGDHVICAVSGKKILLDQFFSIFFFVKMLVRKKCVRKIEIFSQMSKFQKFQILEF